MKRISIITCVFILLHLQAIAENYPYRSNILWVTTPNHSDWLYETGETATISLSVYEYGIPLDGQEVIFTIANDCLEPDKKGSIKLKNGKAEINIGTMKKPGFRDCNLTIKRNGNTYNHHVKVGFSPEKITPYTTMPVDFDLFWKENLEQQAILPMKPEVVFVEEFSSDKIDCYLVKLQCYKPGQYVYGYLTKPKKEGKYPVVVSPPGAGIKPMNPLKTIFYAENGFIRFDMEIHGINPAMDAESYKNISATFGGHNANGYLANGIHTRDTYYLKRVYLACVRAVDYLCSLPEWDGINLATQGGSQGGALALMLAGLDSRITACVANHPALSDMAGYAEIGRTGGYPHFGRKYQNIQLTPEVINTLSYYDVVNFARRITVPVFLTWGFNDNVCPPTTSYAVYNVLSSPKEALITPINEHWTTMETHYQQMAWIKKQLKLHP
ncbi:acetylxylan esterase [Bacteroides sp. 214]|uniref:acetylxylan esterase n=1 Tax=Bacteroides sp. 214 TaxID=2302935 RepID=UPI0013D06360|nr:acetylxylan esterase [Bacteroides sp. 214]NDW12145.1 acetylxylan esterase [Bacteroides sp. 214]